MKKAKLIFWFIFLISHSIHAQSGSQKKLIDPGVYDKWKTLERQAISNDGKWVSYEVNPYKGNGELIVINPDKVEKRQFQRGTRAVFSPNSKYLAFKVVPQEDSIRKLKFLKVKKENFPKDSLYIWLFKENITMVAENLISFKIPEEKSDWIAYLHEKNADMTDTVQKNTGKHPKKNVKINKDAPDVFDLVIKNPLTKAEYRFKDVSEFNISRNGKLVGFIQVRSDSLINSKVSFFDTEKEDIVKVFEKPGLTKNLSIGNSGIHGAFLYSSDTTKIRCYSLQFWTAGMPGTTEIQIEKNSIDMPKNWIVSENGTIWFSRDDSKMYFGTAPKPGPELSDSLLEEEKIKLDIWSWSDPTIQPQQLVELKKEEKKNFLTVYHINEKQVVRLGTDSVPEIRTILFGNSNVALGISEEKYRIESTWKFPPYKDYYIIDLRTGNKSIILEKTTAETNISPFGNYLFWFDRAEKAWFTQNLTTNKRVILTSKMNVRFDDEEMDEPRESYSYGYAGWTKNDAYFLVYDRFDIWKIDPNGIENPVILTSGEGRKNNISFRFEQMNKDLTHINADETIFLQAFNRKTKQSGYFSIIPGQKGNPKQIVTDNFSFKVPIKAKNAPVILWQKGSVKEYPDLWYSDDKLSNPVKISNTNPQQSEYNWATIELVKWKTFEGKEEEGLLYKPENFDPLKKYPMLIYFYELNSDNLNAHITPKPSRANINPIEYASNGYLVFIPNIRYTIGSPGKNAFNYIVSGTKSMISKGFVDEKNIGIQGSSWGGYQVAYLITQTNMFKAASAGAPVANMTSAYGGIYWDIGISRMYMYENTQSRIGATLWERPETYIQNSSLFYADKIETPLLIRHSDNDGAVPWEQGIELYMALRRLNRPVWLLNYNGESHNLRDKSPNCLDLSIRMMQFYNHYLKNEPAPIWMTKGIPAIKKGKTLGYEINKTE